MKISKIIDLEKLKLLTKKEFEDKEVTGVYISDLLSHVIANCEENNIWITILTNLNVPAVAHMTDAAFVIVPENIEVEKNTINKANQKDVIICSSKSTSYKLAVSLFKIIEKRD